MSASSWQPRIERRGLWPQADILPSFLRLLLSSRTYNTTSTTHQHVCQHQPLLGPRRPRPVDPWSLDPSAARSWHLAPSSSSTSASASVRGWQGGLPRLAHAQERRARAPQVPRPVCGGDDGLAGDKAARGLREDCWYPVITSNLPTTDSSMLDQPRRAQGGGGRSCPAPLPRVLTVVKSPIRSSRKEGGPWELAGVSGCGFPGRSLGYLAGFSVRVSSSWA